MLITGRKSKTELEAMREGGKILASIYKDLRDFVQPGVSELEADAWVESEIVRRGAEVTYKTPEVGFPNAICISTNDKIVHGVPTDYRWQQGDVASFDLVITYKGMKTDAAFSMVVGETPSGDKKRLLEFTERSLYAGIEAISGAVKTGSVGSAIEDVLAAGQLGIVRELVGHGVGLKMHMPPDIPNYGTAGSGVLLKPGDTVAIEPMATLGSGAISQDAADGWTIRTADGSLAAHFEHTVLITKHGYEILTQL